MLRLAARFATGWNAVWRLAPEPYAAKLADVATACEREGRDPATFRRTIGLYSLVGETEPQAEATFERARAALPRRCDAGGHLVVVGGRHAERIAQQAIDRIGAFAALGVEEIIVSPWALPFAVIEPDIVSLLAERVLPACR